MDSLGIFSLSNVMDVIAIACLLGIMFFEALCRTETNGFYAGDKLRRDAIALRVVESAFVLLALVLTAHYRWWHIGLIGIALGCIIANGGLMWARIRHSTDRQPMEITDLMRWAARRRYRSNMRIDTVLTVITVICVWGAWAL